MLAFLGLFDHLVYKYIHYTQIEQIHWLKQQLFLYKTIYKSIKRNVCSEYPGSVRYSSTLGYSIITEKNSNFLSDLKIKNSVGLKEFKITISSI